MTGFRIESVARSHEGRVRSNNEDSYCERPEVGLWVVADGMGGHEHGEWASGEIAATMQTARIPAGFDAACTAVADAIHAANGRIWDEATARGQQMGSTVVALHINAPHFAVFWVGDSRAYLLRGGMLVQLSKDHTQVQELVDRGMLTAESAAGHPMSHVLARAVGVQAAVEVDVVTDLIEPGDIFLLCSDGLTGQIEDGEIAEIMQGSDHQAAVDRLVALTLARGAPDNVTVILAGVAEKTMLSFANPDGTVVP